MEQLDPQPSSSHRSVTKEATMLSNVVQFKPKNKKKNKPKVTGPFKFDDESYSGEDDDNVSTNNQPMRIERMSVMKPSQDYQPVVFANMGMIEAGSQRPVIRDLRETLNNNEKWTNKDEPLEKEKEDLEWKLTRVKDKLNRNKQELNRNQQENHYQYWETRSVSKPTSHLSRESYRSRSSYASTRQMEHKGPLTGVPYPPIAEELPYALPLNKSMIGYVAHTPSSIVCSLCHEQHILLKCPTLDNATLEQRWRMVLTIGFCLCCLRPGHSSFTCKVGGSCYRCGTEHNSKLCPKNPNIRFG